MRPMLAKLWRYWSAPLRNDGHGKLSLARCGVAALLLVVFLAVWWKALMGLALAVVLCCFGLMFYSDITKSKTTEILAGRWGMPTADTAVPDVVSPEAETEGQVG